MTVSEQMELEAILAARRRVSVVFVVASLVAAASLLALVLAVASAG